MRKVTDFFPCQPGMSIEDDELTVLVCDVGMPEN